MIHLARDGANMGSFPKEEVQEGLRTGKFLPTDLAWQEGMSEWRPLSQVISDTPAMASGPPSAQPSAPTPATTAMSSTTDATPGSGLPWERRSEIGFFKAFFDTVIMVLTQPATAFSVMRTEGDMMSPMLFALIGGSAGAIVAALFNLALGSIGIMASKQNALGMGFVGVAGLVSIIFAPLWILVCLFVWSGIVHLCLMMVGGAKKSFETTFRVVCFSVGSTFLFAMIPICGRYITAVWNIVAQCIGMSRAHGIDTGKAVIAVLLPLIVCCGGGLLLAILVGGLGALSQMAH